MYIISKKGKSHPKPAETAFFIIIVLIIINMKRISRIFSGEKHVASFAFLGNLISDGRDLGSNQIFHSFLPEAMI